MTYYVPTILLVLACGLFFSNIFAIPKSEILGFISWSNKILLVQPGILVKIKKSLGNPFDDVNSLHPI